MQFGSAAASSFFMALVTCVPIPGWRFPSSALASWQEELQHWPADSSVSFLGCRMLVSPTRVKELEINVRLQKNQHRLLSMVRHEPILRALAWSRLPIGSQRF